MTKENIFILRHGGSLTFWDSLNKLFVRIQLNRKENFICWERWVKKAGGKWVNWNLYLSLKDVVNIQAEIKKNRQQAQYIDRLKSISPNQPDRWYQWQANQQKFLTA